MDIEKLSCYGAITSPKDLPFAYPANHPGLDVLIAVTK